MITVILYDVGSIMSPIMPKGESYKRRLWIIYGAVKLFKKMSLRGGIRFQIYTWINRGQWDYVASLLQSISYIRSDVDPFGVVSISQTSS